MVICITRKIQQLLYNTPQKLDNKLRHDDERKNIIFNKKNLCPQQEENSAKSSKRKSF